MGDCGGGVVGWATVEWVRLGREYTVVLRGALHACNVMKNRKSCLLTSKSKRL